MTQKIVRYEAGAGDCRKIIGTSLFRMPGDAWVEFFHP
jgi:hypothetical protein